MAIVTLNEISVKFTTSRGCPQGGVLSPLLWHLVVNSLLTRLSRGDIFIQGYADDMSSRGG